MNYIIEVTGVTNKGSVHGTIAFSEDPIIKYRWVYYTPFIALPRAGDDSGYPIGHVNAIRIHRLAWRKRKDAKQIRRAIYSASGELRNEHYARRSEEAKAYTGNF